MICGEEEKRREKKRKFLRTRGVEPRSPAWEAKIITVRPSTHVVKWSSSFVFVSLFAADLKDPSWLWGCGTVTVARMMIISCNIAI